MAKLGWITPKLPLTKSLTGRFGCNDHENWSTNIVAQPKAVLLQVKIIISIRDSNFINDSFIIIS